MVRSCQETVRIDPGGRLWQRLLTRTQSVEIDVAIGAISVETLEFQITAKVTSVQPRYR